MRGLCQYCANCFEVDPRLSDGFCNDCREFLNREDFDPDYETVDDKDFRDYLAAEFALGEAVQRLEDYLSD